MKSLSAMAVIVGACAVTLVAAGCGTVPESTTGEWESEIPVSATARLNYQIDSLTNENRRYQQQVEALATENRSLTARVAELETRLSEAAAPKPEVAAPSTGDAMSAYEDALATYRQRDFSGSLQKFEGLLNAGVPDDLADNCHYWMGESYYGARKYREAINSFRMVFNYQRSEKKDDAQLMIGNASLAMGDRAGAREAYNTLISNYPASPLVSKAREKLSRLP